MSVIIFAESSEGKFKKAVFEAVSYGKKLASQLGGQAIAVCASDVLPDETELASLGQYGADKVISVKLDAPRPAAMGDALAQVASAENAQVIVISNNYTGKSVSPVVAVKLKAAVASGVVSLADTSNGFRIRKSVFSGKAFADVDMTSAVKVLAITPNSFAIEGGGSAAPVSSFAYNAGGNAYRVERVAIDQVKGKVPLTEAELVVSGGRGMKGPENWGMIEELANLLGAATACSKPVSDMDWRPHEEHVGQTGITIKPNLYIAVGISGAIQHLAGVSSSKVIVAINKDPEAPFFKVADYGIVGDAFDVLPKLIEAAKSLKAAQ